MGKLSDSLIKMQEAGFVLSDSFNKLTTPYSGKDVFTVDFESLRVFNARWTHSEALTFCENFSGHATYLSEMLHLNPLIRLVPPIENYRRYRNTSSDTPIFSLEVKNKRLYIVADQDPIDDMREPLLLFNPDPIVWAKVLEEKKLVGTLSYFLNPKGSYYIKSVKVQGNRLLIIRYKTNIQNIWVFKEGEPLAITDPLFLEAVKKLQLISGM